MRFRSRRHANIEQHPRTSEPSSQHTNPSTRPKGLADRLVEGTWTVRSLISRLPHDTGCPKASAATSEFQCRCSVRATHAELQALLRDAHAAITS